MTELSKYLDDRGIKKTWFAKKIDISLTRFLQIINEKSHPSLYTAMRIEDVTGGKVKAIDLLSLNPVKEKEDVVPETLAEYELDAGLRIKAASRALLKRAVKKGLIEEPELCESCGERKLLKCHHIDYAKPTVVKWLCRNCYSRVERERSGVEHTCLFCEEKFMAYSCHNRKYCSKICGDKNRKKEIAFFTGRVQ